MVAPSCNLKPALAERLKQARAALGMTQVEWCEASGMPLPSLKNYERAKQIPGGEALCLYLRAGIRVDWLLTGEGPMRLADLAPAAPPALDPDVLSGVLEAIEERLQGRTLKPAKKAALIALVYDSVASGVACEPAVLERYIRLAS